MPTANPTIASLLAAGSEQLSQTSPTARLDAECLLSFVLSVDRTACFTWPDRELSVADATAFQALLARRAAGEPVAYLIGRQAFWDIELQVTPDTLIPRPETELLVEQVLAARDATTQTVLDVGTGSGAIALALAHERPQWHLLASDRSLAACCIANANRQRLAAAQVTVAQFSTLDAVADHCLDVVVSNPPYIGAEEPELQQGDVRFEPASALIAEQQGMAILAALIADAPRVLRPGGQLFLEHGYRQGPAVRAAFAAGPWQQVHTIRDLQGHERVSMGLLVD